MNKKFLAGFATGLLMLGMAIQAQAASVQMLGAEFAASGRFYSVSVTNASLSMLGNTNDFFAAMDFAPNGVLFAASSTLKVVDPSTGIASTIRNINFAGGPQGDILTGITFSSKGELYGIGNGNGNLWRVDPVSANAQYIGTSGYSMFSLEFGPGDRLYAAGHNLYEVDLKTASATQIGAVGGLINALDFAIDGVMYGASGNSTSDSLYSINLQTGIGTVIGKTNGNLVSLASEPVPLPGAVWLLGSGLAGLIGFAKRK